jgi:putative phosphoribosyl transferase
VLALPRGGLPVAAPVAARLGAPLDLVLVRKIGAPGQEELAVGAVVDGPAHEAVFNTDVLAMLGLQEASFADAVAEKLAEIEARRVRYLGGAAPVPVAGRTAIVVDDGIATGATVRAALLGLRRRGPAGDRARRAGRAGRKPRRTRTAREPGGLSRTVPVPFHAVGAHYRDFAQVEDAEVAAILKAARNRRQGG